MAELPDFDEAQHRIGGELHPDEMAECHGILCGLLSCDINLGVGDSVEILKSLKLIQSSAPELSALVTELHGITIAQLDAADMSLQLWLPDDDTALEARAQALSMWCNGLLTGLGCQQGELVNRLSEEGTEALEDLQEIARVSVNHEGDNEAEEEAFTEIVEYVRVATLTIREDLRGPAPDESIH